MMIVLIFLTFGIRFSSFGFQRIVTAAHIVPYSLGQDTMNTMFDRDVDNQPELFSIYNGLLLSTWVEKHLDKGYLVIVPSVPDEPTVEELDQ